MRSWVFEMPREPGTLEMTRKVIPRVSPYNIRVNPSLFSLHPGQQEADPASVPSLLSRTTRAAGPLYG